MSPKAAMVDCPAVRDALLEPAAAPADPVQVIHASQTGHGARVAARLAAALGERGLAAELRDARHVKLSQLRRLRRVVLVASTHGEGEPPDAAQILYRDLMGERAPRLEGLEFAVLALGDRGYEHFCKCGRDLDARLEALGARRFAGRVDCDVDYADDAARWSEGVAAALAAAAPARAGVVSLPHAARRPLPAARAAAVEAVLERNQKITGRGSSKDVRHLEFSFDEGALAYAPGDSLAMRPRNDARLVEAILDRLALPGGAPVELRGARCSLAQALAGELEIAVLARPVIERYAALSGAARLRGLLGEEARAALRGFLAGRDLLDLVEEFPLPGVAPQALVDCLRRLAPRSYSIASGPSANPGEAHLTVGVVAYEARGRARRGAASGFLAAADAGAPLRLELAENPNFRLPADPARDIVMIAAGTGIAPFRAFLEERAATGARGRNWLVLGDRSFDSDFLYQAELLEHRKGGVLAQLDVAFSRDGGAKRYVQHRLREQGAELRRWIGGGAHLYVCGDAARMAPDVHAALAEVAGEEALQRLGREGRYQRDVY